MNPRNDEAPVGAEASKSQSNESSSKNLTARGGDRNTSSRRTLKLRTAAASSTTSAAPGEMIEDGGRLYPVVDCTINEKTETLRVWCPHCQVTHIHGTGGFGWLGMPLLGHRTAHCHSPASPFRERGYILRLAASAVPA